MERWNIESAQGWAKAIGLVPIPLFDSVRAEKVDGTHTVLLDGEKSSFSLSVCSAESSDIVRQVRSWCWSANLRFGFVVRPHLNHVDIVRWDDPRGMRAHGIESERSARLMFEDLAADRKPQAPTAVHKMIRLFRSLRRALLPEGVSPEDTIRVFNALLLGSDAVRDGRLQASEWRNCGSLSDIFDLLANGKLATGRAPNMAGRGTLHMQEFTEVFLEPDQTTGCMLDANLLLRHASGELYQEAHIELERPTLIQGTLFGIPPGAPEQGKVQSDARFTAPALARLLAEFALAARHINADAPIDGMTVLDPACGAGVFLVEAWREISGSQHKGINLVGYDKSPTACEMTRFCLEQSVDADTKITVESRDSLESQDWTSADVILMNPPFIFWNNMTPKVRENVESVLGHLYSDHSDTSLAFVRNAVRLLRPGAALGCVVPATLLESKAGLEWRQSVADDPELALRLVGCFRGFNYFRGAVVEPAFLVIARMRDGAKNAPVQVVLANDGYEDVAIRQARRDPEGTESESPEWSVFQASQDEFPPESWLPRSRESRARLRTLAEKSLPTVGELFKVMLGIRTGLKKAFVLSRKDIARLQLSAEQQRWFRPVAGNATIRSGRLQDTQFIFYPYTDERTCAFDSDDELQSALPKFYESTLLPHADALKARLSKRDRNWWEPSEPRLTWQVTPMPKIVTAYFGQRGSFAFDESGRFAVVQGFGWLWRRGSFDSASLPWAYVALLNSRVFQSILGQFCPTMRGGQYDLSVRFVGRVPIPDLTGTGVTSQTILELAEYGRLISTGEFPPLEFLDRASCRAYGLAFEDWAPPDGTA